MIKTFILRRSYL